MESAERRMQCMEVWGGNALANSHVALSGLDVWVYSRPFQQAAGGGDVYYLSSCATGRISRILLADVSGHGERVSAMAGELRSLMQQYVNYLDQSHFVMKMNQTFSTISAASGQFATAVVGSFFATNNHLTLNNAGHPAPLHYDGDMRRWRLVDSGSADTMDLPLGLEQDTMYSQSELMLGDHDLVLAYTDALIDASDAAGNLLSPEALLAIVSELPPGEPPALVEALLQRIGQMDARNLEADDVTVVLMRPTGELKHLPLSRKLSAPFRFVAQTARAIAKGEPIAWPEWSTPTVGGIVCDAIGRRWKGRRCGMRDGGR